MDWDDEYDDGYDQVNNASHRDESALDPMDIANPVSAYFFLSDDAQDEISAGKKKNMKCGSCGHTFVGESYDSCPEGFSPDTEKAADEKDDRY